MISEKMRSALNKQINAEFYASYLYLAMSAHFEDTNMNGFAHWMSMQSQEEYGHAMKIFNYLNEVGAKVELDSIEKPVGEWKEPVDAFKAALEHEKKVTKMINDLADLAVEEKDHATNIFLHWFVTEQVEEVASVEEIVNKFELIGDNKGALFMFDRELGSRQDQGA